MMTPKALLREVAAVVLLGVAAMMALALSTFTPHDPSFDHAIAHTRVHNQAGIVGAYMADALYQMLGYGGWILALLIAGLAARMAMGRPPYVGGWTALFWLPFMVGIAALLHAHGAGLSAWLPSLPSGPGGAIGRLFDSSLVRPLHALGRDILLLVLALSSFVAASHLSLLGMARQLLRWLGQVLAAVRQQVARLRAIASHRRERIEGREKRAEVREQRPMHIVEAEAPPVAEPAKVEVSRRAKVEQQRELAFKAPSKSGFKLPELSLFNARKEQRRQHTTEALQAMARLLEKKLLDYRVEGKVVGVQPGPVVTQFEFEPAPGTKVSRIIALQDDLARAMSAISVRVAGNIPGKNAVGIELPNEERETVLLHEVLASKSFSDKRHVLPLALGVDIAGHAVVVDLARMPHLLVAGTTGSGKSVSVNGMICSLLMTYTPQDLRLIMVDPKMLELSMYDDIPHLLVPVVTNPHKAAKALAWAVFEMERRYQLMAEAKVRNLEGYNRAVQGQKPDAEGRVPERLPFIVIVIDELADLMMVAGKDVEQSICRIAQKARAAGIHLILATQRPSVDVITGLIKANLPSRISFQVSSKIDSRTILDQMGAEQLLGQGDSLVLSSGRDLRRVHGAFVSDGEVHALVEYLRSQGRPDYREEVFEVPAASEQDAGGFGEDAEADDKYDEAVALVIDKGQCSVSMVQRYLRIGYNRASRMVERMEREGLVTPPGAGGVRKVLARSQAEGGGVVE
jgi:DNA segregation ATPase FtsK/SpoIIIE, S-DNA-T family